jgi:hypothetical protein
MRRSDLEQAGGFIGVEPVARDVTWTKPDGEQVTMTALVLQLPFDAFEKYSAEEMSNIEKTYQFLGEAILIEDENGAAVPLGYADAKRLNRGLMVELLKVAQEVNNLTEGKS